jgi:hypothetical protein
VTAAPFLGWSSMTDTCELPLFSGARLAEAPTTFIPLAVAFADVPPRPDQAPPPQRLPKRLRRRAGHLLLAATSVAGFATALLAGGVLG